MQPSITHHVPWHSADHKKLTFRDRMARGLLCRSAAGTRATVRWRSTMTRRTRHDSSSQHTTSHTSSPLSGYIFSLYKLTRTEAIRWNAESLIGAATAALSWIINKQLQVLAGGLNPKFSLFVWGQDLHVTQCVIGPRDLRIGRLRSNRIRIEAKEMYGTTNSSFQSSNTLNNTGVWSLIELASLYTVRLSAINGLSRLTTTSNGQARPIRKFSNRPMTFESIRIGTSNSNRIESRIFAGP